VGKDEMREKCEEEKDQREKGSGEARNVERTFRMISAVLAGSLDV
jgi:hypothetical protein